jgi:DNA-binding protein HU-beta
LIDAHEVACYKALAVVPSGLHRIPERRTCNGFPDPEFRRLPYPPKGDFSKMNKAELIDAVADTAGLSKSDASRAVDAAFDAVTKALKRGDKVALVGFGTFSVRKRAARMGRNPKTGAAIKIPAGKTPGFKAGKALKDAVN